MRACFGKDRSVTGFEQIAAAGFTVVDRPAFRSALDALRGGMRGWVWLGDYKNDQCAWEKSDDWIREHVSAIARHPAIAAYFLADEPHIWDCPNLPAQIRARSQLVKSLDPGPPTFVVIKPHSPGNPYAPYAGTTDVIAADVYPCSHAHGCVMEKIDEAVQLLADAKIGRYWGIVQAFEDNYYRLPEAAEYAEQMRRWRASRMDGYLAFSWSFGKTSPADHPSLVAEMRSQNSR